MENAENTEMKAEESDNANVKPKYVVHMICGNKDIKCNSICICK